MSFFTSPTALVETPGIQGELVWADKYKTHIGYYPPECLPSSSTEYFSYFAWSQSTNPYLNTVGLGGSPLGTTVISGIFPLGLPTGQILKWDTKHKHIFAQCELRINEPVIITQEMIDKNEITMPDYIYEMAAATEEQIEIPPVINQLPDYIFNVSKYEEYETTTIQATLLFETAVHWSLTDKNAHIHQGSRGEKAGPIAAIDDSGLIAIIPQRILIDTELTISATNSSGSDEKTIKINIVEGNDDPKIQIISPSEIMDKDRAEILLWNRITANRTNISNNLFSGIVINKAGIYYRLDNGESKALGSVGQMALMPVYTPWYNDSSSRKFTLLSDISDFEVGDILYVTYYAVKEHYLRQIVNISWFAIDAGYLGFVGYATSITAANFRFYQWKIPGTENETDNPNTTETEIEGWRCVETFNVNPAFSAIICENLLLPNFAFFGNGGADANTSIYYLPTETPFYQVLQIINDPNYPFPYFKISADASSDGHFYEINKTFPYQGLPLEKIENTWLYQYFNEYPDFRYSLAIKHLVYNMHPDALVKRDIDKVALPISLSDALSEAINNGEKTEFPFYDIPTGLDKWKNISKMLDSSNYKIESIDSVPKTISTANAFSITSPLGIFPGIGTGYLYGEFRSNLIQETFKKGTRILVEGNVLGTRGSVLLSVKCKGGGTDFVSCTQDMRFNNIFVYSINNDNFLMSRKLKYSLIESDLKNVVFKPDDGGINYNTIKNSTTIDDFPVVGFSGLLGDSPGIFPGKVISFYKYSINKAFKEYYYGKAITNIDAKKEVGTAFHDSGILIQLGELVYTGRIKAKITLTATIKFNAPIDDKEIRNKYITKEIPELINRSFQNGEGLMLFLNGSKIESAIDSIPIGSPALDSYKTSQTIDNKTQLTINISQSINHDNYYWLKGDSIKISLPFFDELSSAIKEIDSSSSTDKSISISSISIIGIKSEYAKDFLSGKNNLKKNEEDKTVEWEGNNFIETDCATSCISDKGHIYLFFDDKNNGISCIHSPDDGVKWELQYGIKAPIDDYPIKYPFSIRSSASNRLFLFMTIKKALYMMAIDLYDLSYNDKFDIQDDPANFIGKIRNANLYLVAGNNDSENIAFIQKNNLKMGSTTIFTNTPFNTMFYSAYQNAHGALKVFFLDDRGKVQCHYSTDGGITWADLWVCMAEGNDGLIKNIKENFGKTQSSFPYGIYFHKSSDETQIESPYFFHSPRTDRTYAFFVYKNCLLCKIIFDPINCQYVSGRNNYENFSKSIEESKSHFIDGDASQIKSELDQAIVMIPQSAIDRFSPDRAVASHRMCAVETKNGQVKIFYKLSDGGIRSAWYDGHTWTIDDMMRPSKAK